MEFVCKYPLEVLVGSTCPSNSNRVLGNLNIIDLSSSDIVSAQASLLANEISLKSDLNECSIEYQPVFGRNQSRLCHYFLMARMSQLKVLKVS